MQVKVTITLITTKGPVMQYSKDCCLKHVIEIDLDDFVLAVCVLLCFQCKLGLKRAMAKSLGYFWYV